MVESEGVGEEFVSADKGLREQGNGSRVHVTKSQREALIVCTAPCPSPHSLSRA